MRTVSLLPIVAALAVSPVLPTAAVAQTVEERPPADEQDDHVEAFFKEFYERNYDSSLRIASRIDLPDTKEGRALKNSMRAAALMGLKRHDEAARLFDEADKLSPGEPSVSWLQFEAALMTDKFDVAAAALDTMIARFPDKVREIEWKWVRHLLKEERRTDRKRYENHTVELARLGYGGDAEWGDYIAFDAIGFLLKRGDAAGAEELVPYVDQLDAVQSMLVRKRFAPLWPKLEQHAGPRFDKVRGSMVSKARQAFEKSPEDPETLQLLVNALHSADENEEAIALRSKLPATREAMASADEQVGWAVNNIAYALYDVGRDDEADELFARLNESSIDDDGWLVSMVINRHGALIKAGRFDKAFALLDATETTAREDGNEYARQLVRSFKHCLLSRLDREQDAGKHLSEMLKHAGEAYAATVEALVCAGDLDQAEEIAVQALAKNEDYEEDFVRDLQLRPLSSGRQVMWADSWQEFRKRPAIAKAFDRLGRDMPAQFLPADQSRTS